MQVGAGVSESDIGGVAVGQEVKFTVNAYPGTPFQGQVSQARNSPAMVQNAVTWHLVQGDALHDLRGRPGLGTLCEPGHLQHA